MRKHYSLYGRLLNMTALHEAFRQVKRNRGAPGIDGQSISAFAAAEEAELSCLLDELKGKRYRAQPVRRVTIPKPGGGERLLGIPTVRDRIVQLAQWKKPQKLHRRLKQLGYKPPFRFIRMGSWRNASSPLAHYVMPNNWFHDEMKLVDMAGVDVGMTVSV